MHQVGPQDTRLSLDIYDSITSPAPVGVTADTSQQMWDYRNRNKFRDIPVAKGAVDLPVNSLQELQHALQLKAVSKVWVGYISPAQQDVNYVQAYQQLKQRQDIGQLVIIDQDRQFCPGLNKYMVLVTYSEMAYQLNPRFQFLKQEKI